MSLFDEVMATYRAGDTDRAIRQALALVHTAEGEQALALAGLFLAAQGRADELDQLDHAAQARGLGRAVLFTRVMKQCLDLGQLTVLETIVNAISRSSVLFPLSVHFAGCARLSRGFVDEALAMFRLFRELASQPSQQGFLKQAGVNRYFRQGGLVLTAEEIPARLAAAELAPPACTEFVIQALAAGDGPVALAVADGRYIKRFAEEFVRSIPQGRPVHLHAVNVQDDIEIVALLDRLRQERQGELGISTSVDAHYGHAVAYACARFFVAPALLDAYKRRVIVLDIDVAVTTNIDIFYYLKSEFDFAVFQYNKDEPSSYYACGLFVCEPTEYAQDFLDSLGKFCLPALNLTYQTGWFLDQAALLSVKQYYVRRHPAFRWGELKQLTGRNLLDFIPCTASDDEKNLLRFGVSMPKEL